MFLSAKDMADRFNYQLLAISTLKGTLENVRSQNIEACSCSHIRIRILVPCLYNGSFLLKPRLEGRYIILLIVSYSPQGRGEECLFLHPRHHYHWHVSMVNDVVTHTS